jgi:uncharacterized membrane protein YraQ (UPF0718 family)
MALALIASIAALLLGPLLYSRSRGARVVTALDAFALVGVGGLVFLEIVPQSFARVGWVALPFAALGAIGPGLLCETRLLGGGKAARIAMPLALLGIAVHDLFDGAALAGTGEERGAMHLALAVVLHRLTEGFGVWWLARPTYGARVATGLLGAIVAFTLVGFLFGDALLQHAPATWIALFQAFVAGSLLHVILRHAPVSPSVEVEGRRVPHPLASGVGGLCGVALVAGLESFHLEPTGAPPGLGASFLALVIESAPALVVAYVAIAAVHALELDLPRLLGGGGRLGQTLRGTVAGLPMPLCSCGVIPIYKSLIQKNVPGTAAIAFLVAAPEFSLAALFLSWELLGPGLTLARVASAALLALAVGLVLGTRIARPAAPAAPLLAQRRATGERLRDGVRYGLGEMVDGTAPWILLGIALAAALDPLLAPEILARFPDWLEVPLFALVGMPLYVCASGSTPLVALFLAKGASAGAAVAFLLTGPATNVTTFGVLSQMHGKGLAAAFTVLVAGVTIAIGWTVDAVLPAASIPRELALHDHAPSAFELASLVALGALFVVSLLRQGTRGFLAQVITPHANLEQIGHGHGASHAHERAAAEADSCCATSSARRA